MKTPKELLEFLSQFRGDRELAYDCECCGTGFEWNPDSKHGEYLRWDDVKEALLNLGESI